jgi:hypothetical protein
MTRPGASLDPTRSLATATRDRDLRFHLDQEIEKVLLQMGIELVW